MRTTLKKGIGRGAEVNGNGRAVIPPGALSPVTLYRQALPARPGFAKVVFKFFLWLAVVLVMLVTSFVGGVYLWAHERAAAARCKTTDCKRGEQSLDAINNPHHAAVALVIGYDHRAGDQGAPSRSDTMMLIRADPTTNTISLLSFPRDLDVPIWCPGRTASGSNNGPPVVYTHGRINSAYALCGSSGSIETVKHLTGLPVNYLIRVNFLGFISVVNKLGGVWLDIDRRYYNKNVGTIATDFANIDLQPGYQLLTGKQALDFVRFRHTDSDLFRLARQQQYVTSMRQQIARSLGVSSLIRIVNTITKHHYLEVGVGGGNQYDLGTIYSYAGSRDTRRSSPPATSTPMRRVGTTSTRRPTSTRTALRTASPRPTGSAGSSAARTSSRCRRRSRRSRTGRASCSSSARPSTATSRPSSCRPRRPITRRTSGGTRARRRPHS